MSRSPRCYIQSFVGKGPLGLEKKIFEGLFTFLRVFTIYGHGGHLGHVTSIMLINFHFHLPNILHTKFGKKLPSGF